MDNTKNENKDKKLFLASYFSGVAGLFPDFAGNDCTGKKVVFIPTASIPEKITFYVGADKKALVKLGLIVDELEVSSASPDETADNIAGADYVFVSGGNTFFLLQELKRTEADKLIIEHINRGKLYRSRRRLHDCLEGHRVCEIYGQADRCSGFAGRLHRTVHC
jgi:dipeptidase E